MCSNEFQRKEACLKTVNKVKRPIALAQEVRSVPPHSVRNVAWLTPQQKTIAHINKCTKYLTKHKYALIMQKHGQGKSHVIFGIRSKVR